MYILRSNTGLVLSKETGALRLCALPLRLRAKTFTFACRKALRLHAAFTGRITGKYR